MLCCQLEICVELLCFRWGVCHSDVDMVSVCFVCVVVSVGFVFVLVCVSLVFPFWSVYVSCRSVEGRVLLPLCRRICLYSCP